MLAALLSAIAVLSFLAAVTLGVDDLVGTFGVTGLTKDCGSVWELITGGTGDLNAATCKPELLHRVTVLGVLIGVTGTAITSTVVVLARRRSEHPRGFRLSAGVAALLLTPWILGLAFVLLGRHRAWMVSGA